MTKDEIKKARKDAGLTQAQAAILVHAKSYRTWQNWELGVRKMPLATWKYFLIKAGELK